MTPVLLVAVLSALSAVLLWQLWSIRRWLAGRKALSQSALPRAVKLPLKRVPSAEPSEAPRRARKNERKRGLSSIHAEMEGPSAAERLIRSGLYNEVEAKLGQAFELYADGAISIDGYVAIVSTEAKVVSRKRNELNAREMADHSSPASLYEMRQDVETAEIAIQWCLDWADDRRKSGLPPQPDPDQG